MIASRRDELSVGVDDRSVGDLWHGDAASTAHVYRKLTVRDTLSSFTSHR